jgi:alkaline phosphatase
MKNTSISRRNFFGRTALTAGGLATLAGCSSNQGFHIAKSSGALNGASGQKPARIIHVVADGMSMGTFTCADYFSHQTRQRNLAWADLMRNPAARNGLMNTRSINSMVPDSASASSAWGSGSLVKNGVLNQLPSGHKLTTLYQLFAQLGWKRGLVTTTEITHATPAGFAITTSNRDTGSAIAVQYLQSNIDVLLGGGQKFFDAKLRKDKRDLKADYIAAKYQVMTNAAALSKAPLNSPWLGIFTSSHMPYVLDRANNPKLLETVPSLAAMTERALQWFERHDHFILQIEGGNVDHAAHICDAPATLHEMIAFDEALDLVLAFQKKHPDTLVVITTDHGTANMGVNGSGNNYGQSSQMFKRAAGVKASLAEVMRQLRKKPPEEITVQDDIDASSSDYLPTNPAPGTRLQPPYVPTIQEIKDIVAATTNYKVKDRGAELFRAFLDHRGNAIYDMMNSDTAQLGQLLANHLAVGWSGNSHTSDHVPITAVGPGAERFVGLIQNTDLFRHYTELAGIDFKNKEEPLMAGGPEAGDVENIAEYSLV